MKKLFCIVVAPVLFLTACASVSTSTKGVSAQSVASTSMYCWKERLTSDSNELTCNWAGSATDACEETKSSTISKAAVVAEPVTSKRCNNGQWLVQVMKKA